MITTGSVQKSLSQRLFEQLLTENGLEVPDGRMLFKYGISPELRKEIWNFLKPGAKGDEFVEQGNMYACALWVFMLASAWSEHYYDGSWSWNLTLKQAGFEGSNRDYKNSAKLGFLKWGFEFDEFRGEYQKAIVRHAGLPRKRIMQGGGYLFELVRDVVFDSSDRERLSEELALELLKRDAKVLPLAFRKETFLKSLADLCSVIHKSIFIHQESDQAEAIRALYPQFQKAEIDCLLSLQTRVIKEVREAVRKKPFRLRFRRLIEVDGEQLYPLILIQAGRTCQHSSIIEMLPEGRAVKNHYFVVASRGMERQVIAELRRVDTEIWDLRQRSERLPSAWFCNDIKVSLERDGAEVAALESCSVNAPDLYSTLVFSLYDHSETSGVTRFELESGSPQEIDTAEFVLGLPDSAEWKSHLCNSQGDSAEIFESAPESVICLKAHSFLPHYSFVSFRGCLVEVSVDGNLSSCHFGTSDRQDRFRLVGRTLTISEHDSVTVGIPRLYRLCDDGSLQRVESNQSHGLEVSWTPTGMSPMRLTGNESRIHGPGHLEVSRVVDLPFPVGGKNKLRSRLLRQYFVIVPQNASVKKTSVDGQPGIHLVNWPLANIYICSVEDQKLYGYDRSIITPAEGARMIYGRPQVHGGQCAFRFEWVNGSSSQLTLPSPHECCEIVVGNTSSRLIVGQESVKVDLEELIYTQISIQTPETNDSLRLIVQALDQIDGKDQNLWHFKHTEVIKKNTFNIRLRFDSLGELVRQQFLLCRGRNPKVAIEVQRVVQMQPLGDRQTIVRVEVVKSRVEAKVDQVEGILNFRVTRGEGSAEVSPSCRVLALNLVAPRELPKEIGMVSMGGSTSIANLLDPTGVWFIYPAEDSETSFTPAIYPGPAARAANLADFTEDLLQRAILTPDATRRSALLDDYLLDLENRIRGRDPRNLGSWKILAELCAQLGHIESDSFDLFNALARRPALLALLLLLEKERLERFEVSSQRSLKINWMLMGLADWMLVVDCLCVAVKSDLGGRLAMKPIVRLSLEQYRDEIVNLLWNQPYVFNDFIDALVRVAFDSHLLPGEFLTDSDQMMLASLCKKPQLIHHIRVVGVNAPNVERSSDESDLSEYQALQAAKDSMPCTDREGSSFTTLADSNAVLACPTLFYDETSASANSIDHKLFFRLLVSQSMLTDQRKWRCWIEENFGLIQYSIQRHPADAVAIMDECLLIQLSLHYNRTKDRGIES